MEAAGATLVAISPQLPRHSRALESKLGLSFPILHDRANRAAERYGLRYELPDDLRDVYASLVDLAEHHGEGGWALPMPARYVVDRDGVVRYADVQPDYAKRPEPEETLEAVRDVAR